MESTRRKASFKLMIFVFCCSSLGHVHCEISRRLAKAQVKQWSTQGYFFGTCTESCLFRGILVQGGQLLVINYHWSQNPYKWPHTWLTGVITSISGVITGRGPPCIPQSTFLNMNKQNLQFRGGVFQETYPVILFINSSAQYEIKFVVISQSSFSFWWFPNVFKYFDSKDLEDSWHPILWTWFSETALLSSLVGWQRIPTR